ncbi:ERGIC and golgi 2 [Seminavis robusta]|uniref:ERGIC and golgi 2 n=1 Tax=Seminavis robusta TaxID=568900 RepID=A0A9N8E8Q0_9STRA|nr:ERGIC and golgi 2 [Seminavis robusta]|eukprot:Sro618_g176250.1 ERGIC and golgi 2 (412) ;mRNA; r:28019-29330
MTNDKKDLKCLICLEDNACTGFSLVQLNDESKCRHSVCRACLRHYLVQSENDRRTNANCPEPDCRAQMLQSVVEDILGRSYSPKVWIPGKVGEEKAQKEDPEESLERWLRENGAQQCLNCNVWITREEGCDAMQCLCGWRFCWECVAPIRTSKDEIDVCICGHSNTDFYDNILNDEGLGVAPRLATLEELRDMAAFYERRKDEDNSDEYMSNYDRSEVESYAVDEELDSEWDKEYEDEDAVVEEDCTVYIGSIFDYVEPALGVFAGTLLDWEEPLEAGCVLVALWADMMDMEDSTEEGVHEDDAQANDMEDVHRTAEEVIEEGRVVHEEEVTADRDEESGNCEPKEQPCDAENQSTETGRVRQEFPVPLQTPPKRCKSAPPSIVCPATPTATTCLGIELTIGPILAPPAWN